MPIFTDENVMAENLQEDSQQNENSETLLQILERQQKLSFVKNIQA